MHHPPAITLPQPSQQSLIILSHTAPIPHHHLTKSLKTHFPTPTAPVPRQHTPSTLSQLQRVILLARSQNRRIKPTSNPLSPSSQAAYKAGAIILNTCNLTAVTRSKDSITAQCGVRLNHLPISSIPPDRSVGSAIADGVLSLSGFGHGLVADSLIGLSLLDSNGRLRMYRRDDPTGIFNTLVVSHGLCGIIYEAQFKTSFLERVVRLRITTSPIQTISPNGLKNIVNGRTAAELSWIPFNSCDGVHWHAGNDSIIIKAIESTPRELSQGRCIRYSTIPQFILRNSASLAAGGYTGFEGWHTRIILSEGFQTVNEDFVTTLRHAVAEGYDRRAVHEESVCFSLDFGSAHDWERIVKAWKFVVGLVKECDAKDRYPLNMMMKLRFVGGSDGLLAVNRSTSCILSIVSANGTPDWEDFSRRVVKKLIEMGGSWVVNRCGVENISDRVKFVKRVARNAGLDDCGMFEDFVVGLGEMRVLEAFESISDVSDADVVVVQERRRGELWWVWIYVVAYMIVWCWLFGQDAVREVRASRVVTEL